MTEARPKPYHHGDLRNALLAEAERLLEAQGMRALTLRAVARGVGVTHAAPANHFGDLTGLLSELAADGLGRLAEALAAGAVAGGAHPAERAKGIGEAYVAFAAAHRGLFALMFRAERLDPERPALKAAILKSRQALGEALAARPDAAGLSPLATAARATALWSLVHGYAMLLIDRRLQGTFAALPKGTTPDTFFRLVLESITLTK
jgi:AcrR family transcriptional regulator